jgi:hypothetical protein
MMVSNPSNRTQFYSIHQEPLIQETAVNNWAEALPAQFQVGTACIVKLQIFSEVRVGILEFMRLNF